MGNAGYDSTYGHGLIQAYDALNDGGGVTLGPPQVASDPYPTDNATGVSIDSSLSWIAGADADTHKVYFGTDTLVYEGEIGITSYDPGLLVPDTLYQWQIIEVNSKGETPGPIWLFTTDATTQCTDADADGFCVSDGDCNDSDNQVYPGHQDKRGKWGRNGIDNDCNGIIDG